MDELTCKKCEKMISAYLAGELSDDDNLMIIEHIKTCPSCKDELTVQSMVSVGLNNLDEIININIDAQLDKTRKESLRRLYKADFKERLYLGCLFGGVSILFLAVLLIVL